MSRTETLRKLLELGEQFRNYALLRVAKNRQGRTGDVHLFYHGEFTFFRRMGRRGADQAILWSTT